MGDVHLQRPRFSPAMPGQLSVVFGGQRPALMPDFPAWRRAWRNRRPTSCTISIRLRQLVSDCGHTVPMGAEPVAAQTLSASASSATLRRSVCRSAMRSQRRRRRPARVPAKRGLQAAVKTPSLPYHRGRWTISPRAICVPDAQGPPLKAVAKVAGALPLRRRAAGFAGLARIITGQQLSVASANAIWARFEVAFPDMTPDAVLSARVPRFRKAGMSAAKIKGASAPSPRRCAAASISRRWRMHRPRRRMRR